MRRARSHAIGCEDLGREGVASQARDEPTLTWNTTVLRLKRLWRVRGQPQAVLVPDEALGALTNESILRNGRTIGIQRAKRDERERQGAPCCGLTPTQRCRRRPRTSPGRTAPGLGPRTAPPPAQNSRLTHSKTLLAYATRSLDARPSPIPSAPGRPCPSPMRCASSRRWCAGPGSPRRRRRC